ncbi:glycosyltransferase family 2 protein [Falsirhodobacter sp. 20TX0035]|uniref:glycosyltransferase family 2 protein n=1 Tax=Falsirhodobacter sp. 20TX0035 TaxID=3022019 RepID=UPI00232E7BC7|nr:glycosyltransferase [Falsirhodobacter sp. 20TX0035]MDB6454793.1 glycosyltransferase [Falsirhodobacter sp. 20TX0035]
MNTVSVIIPAHNSRRTIAQAIRSALAEPEVAEVLVVDDASADDTAAVAQGCEDGSGRLRVIRLDRNVGPAKARNEAIEIATASWIAILDSDDILLPGRFARLFAAGPFDLAADNIALVPDHMRDTVTPQDVAVFPDAPTPMSLSGFVAGNLGGRAGMGRDETGLLKPIIRREFLLRSGLRYDEGLRLGEDFILYVRLMARGARFITIRSCGYVAFQRPDSLSVKHRTADLKAFADAAAGILRDDALPADAQELLRQQERFTRNKFHHRLFLDQKSEQGLLSAARRAMALPAALWPILRLTARDKRGTFLRKMGLVKVPHEYSGIRYLLQADR